MLKELNSIFLIYLLRKSIILYHLPTVSHIVMRHIDVQMSLSLFFLLSIGQMLEFLVLMGLYSFNLYRIMHSTYYCWNVMLD